MVGKRKRIEVFTRVGRRRFMLRPPDTRERHLVAARALGAGGTVLDVGGRRGELAAFLPGARVSTANVEPPADVLYDGERLPFPDGSFDAAASLDVLEHVPRELRRTHLEELLRVARRNVVACFPLGTDEHVRAERELAEWHLSLTGYSHRFLGEHDLPTEAEVRELVAGLPFELWFHGDFRRAAELFRLGARARRLEPRALAAYIRALAAPADLELSERPSAWTNRVFLVGQSTTTSGHPRRSK
jgi:SAM-dependent methyltransferase